MPDVNKCANPACSCFPPDKVKYCSAHCEGMADKVELLCGCEHDSCHGAVTEPDVAISLKYAPETVAEPGSLPEHRGDFLTRSRIRHANCGLNTYVQSGKKRRP